MNKKVNNYIEVLFSDVPKTNKAKELKEELLANMNERFDDYMNQGKTENQAYSLVISNLGDVDHLIEEVMPTEGFKKEAHYYRKRNAIATSISVMLYIIGAAFLIGISEYYDSEFGVLILLVLAAIATGILIYANMSTPKEYVHDDEDAIEFMKFIKTKKGREFEELGSLVWMVATLIFFIAGFVYNQFGIAWIIFPITGILLEIIKTIIRIGGKDE